MAKDLQGSDNNEIDVQDDAACAKWAHEFGVDAGELKAAVHNVGPKRADVQRYIEERKLPPLGRDTPGTFK